MTTRPHIRVCACCPGRKEYLTTDTGPTPPRCAECRKGCYAGSAGAKGGVKYEHKA